MRGTLDSIGQHWFARDVLNGGNESSMSQMNANHYILMGIEYGFPVWKRRKNNCYASGIKGLVIDPPGKNSSYRSYNICTSMCCSACWASHHCNSVALEKLFKLKLEACIFFVDRMLATPRNDLHCQSFHVIQMCKPQSEATPCGSWFVMWRHWGGAVP